MDISSSIWPALPTPAFVIDAENRIVAVNPAAETFNNESARLLLGSPFLDRLAIDAPVEDALSRLRADGSPMFINNVEVSSGQAAPVLCNIQIAPMQDAPGHVLLLMQPRQLAGHIGREQALKTSARSAIGMADMLAHEIKNPLAGITGAAQLLSMNLAADDLELTELIVSESRRIVKLLEKVEQFGHAGAPQFNPVNVHDFLDRARKSAILSFGSNMRFVEEYDPSLPAARADGDQLLQVFLNLMKNATDAAPNGRGTITLRTYYDQSLRLRRADGGGQPLPLQIEIVDDGPGLPPDIADDIFEPFVSGRQNGSGLGLALASKIIAEHEGWIQADSVPGQTRFRISLPLFQDFAKGEQ